MTTKTLFLLVAFSLICNTKLTYAIDDSSEWYPFIIGEKLDHNSPANIGKLVLDAPAGKHGFVKVKNGHFYFEDGARAKFWGTNLAFSACFPSKKQAEIIADRIAFFGFNAVRLHHMDFYFEPIGIFEDISPAFKNPQMKKTGVLSKKQLDKLDYLIYQLKIRGIYVDMNLLVSRHFTEADGIKDAEKLGMAAKPVSMFDEKLIGLQKKYAKDLFTHYNPYTNLRYCDDPAIALIEITNENSIIKSWNDNKLNGQISGLKKNAIPDFYSAKLDKLWNAWLKEKYKTADNVKKSWMSHTQNINPFEINFDLTNWTTEQLEDAVLTKKTTSNSAILTINKITDVPWHLQFKTLIPVKKGKVYSFNFSARSNKETKLGVISQLSESPWTNLDLSETIGINNELKYFKITFSPNNDTDKAKIGFIVGYSKAEIEIQDITLKEIGPIELSEQEKQQYFHFQRPLHKLLAFYPNERINDIQSFYIDLQKRYFQDMVYYLKNEIGVRIPIAGIGGYSLPEDILTQEHCDFLDKHAYWDHPRFPRKIWDINDFTIHNKSLLQDSNLGFIKSLVIASREVAKQSKPFTVTEWNHCYPNKYSYETPVLLASEAAKNNIDALFQFAFSHGWKSDPKFDSINSYFDSIANAQQLILCSLGSLLFQKGKDINFEVKDGVFTLNSEVLSGKIDRDEAVFSTKTASFIVSEIKNTKSHWDSKGKYNWGGSPTLVRKLRIDMRRTK